MNLRTKRGSKGELFWKVIFVIIGMILIISVLTLPIVSRFYFEKENIPLELSDYGLLSLGFFFVFGYKSFGTITNNIGLAITNLLNKFSK